MGLDENKTNDPTSSTTHENDAEGADNQAITGQPSEHSVYVTEEDEEESKIHLELGPMYSLREHLEKDKDDESLRKWKEQLLGNVDVNSAGETFEPEVKILTLTIVSPGRADIVLPIPENGDPKGLWFTLKEGCTYVLRFCFTVSNNIVSGLRYTNTVWKTGVKVDSTKEMLGTFSPQQEPYTHEIPEELTPSGYFARGAYSARSKVNPRQDRLIVNQSLTFCLFLLLVTVC
ncbi:Rab GDP dissociation inhibitor alpha [Dionaea muscipula]